jgi:DNA polymerase elongation subunit (family B)
MTQKPIEFQIISWDAIDEIDDDNGDEYQYTNTYIIHLCCRTLNDKTVYAKITEFKPFFYVEIPDKWNTAQIQIFFNEIKSKMSKKFRNSLERYEIVKRHKFTEFTDYAEFTFLRLIFSNHESYKKCKYLLFKEIKLPETLSSKPLLVNLYEANLDPFLRCMHIREIQSTGWVSISEYKLLPTTATTSDCDINIETSWMNINPMRDVKIMSPITIMSYDIECASLSGDFPTPKKDPVIMIGLTFNKYGQTECYNKTIIVLGETKKIDGATIITCKTEEEVLLAWQNLLHTANPDILVTFNGFGFDNKYLYERAAELKISHKFMKLSRFGNKTSRFIEQKLQSSALGENLLYYFSFEGRVQIDMMKLVQQIAKLDSYSLDSVAAAYIKETVIDFELNDKDQTTIIKTKSTIGLEKGRSVSIYYNDGLTDNKHNNGEKYFVLDVTANTITVDKIIDKSQLDFVKCKVFWCQAKDDISHHDIFACLNGTKKQRQKIAKYCIQDCVLLNTLMSKLNILNNYVGMANACHVPLSYIFMRGQGIKIFSLVAEKCRREKHLIPTIKKALLDYDFENKSAAEETSVLIDEVKKYEIKMTENKMSFDSSLSSILRIGKQIAFFEKNKNGTYIKIHTDEILIDKCVKTKFFINKVLDLDSNKQYCWVYEDSSYEGATVFEPTTGIHRQPVAILDYKSLYPSAMIMCNMSPECFVSKFKSTQKMPNCEYFSVEAKLGANKIKTVTFVKKENRIGILAQILIDLLDARSRTRKMIDKEPDPFMKGILDGLQLAYKIIANSLYGQTGAKTSQIYKKEIAAATTATGRDMLLFAKDFVENKMNMLFAVLNKQDKHASDEDSERRIEKRKKKYQQKQYDEFCEQMDLIFPPDKLNPNRLKNHICNKLTKQKKDELKCEFSDTRLVEFRKSLATKYNHDELKQMFYKDCYDELMHILDDGKITAEPGIVYGDSVTGDTPILLQDMNGNVVIKTIETIGKSWEDYDGFKSDDLSLSDKQCDSNITNYKVWTSNGWSKIKRVIRHKTCKQIYEIITQSGYVKVTEDHSLLKSNGEIIKPTECVVGTELLHGFPPAKHNLNILYKNHPRFQSWESRQMNATEAMEFFYDKQMCGYCMLIKKHPECNLFTLIINKRKVNPINQIISINCLGYQNNDDYVYDLETETGNFHAGVGQLIVKNTDSVFTIPNFRNRNSDEILTDKSSLQKAIKLGELISEMTFMIMLEPMELEYEKTYWPLCLLKKKKYVGNLYQFDPNKYYQNNMGIVLKRRDNAPIVKMVCGGIVRELLNNTAKGAVDFTKQLLADILNGKISFDKFMMTKTLRATYKTRSAIAHAVLADRIEQRTGNKIDSNTRMNFIYFLEDNDKCRFKINKNGKVAQIKSKGKLQGDMIEDPEYIKEHNLRVDTLFYLVNQIMKPSCQFLDLVIDDSKKLFMHYIMKEINAQNGKKLITEYY